MSLWGAASGTGVPPVHDGQACPGPRSGDARPTSNLFFHALRLLPRAEKRGRNDIPTEDTFSLPWATDHKGRPYLRGTKGSM